MFHNPLIGSAVDDGISKVSEILAGSPADGAAIVADLRTWLRSQEDASLRQILSLYGQARLTSSADASLVDAALGAL